MPSFDIVSQVNSMEIENAVNQAKKELANRFDFKGSNAEIALEKDEIKLSAPDAFKIKARREHEDQRARRAGPFAARPRAPVDQNQTRYRDSDREGNHRLHPRRQV